MLLDVHTHTASHPGEQIESVTPQQFAPQVNHLYSVGIHPWHVATATEADWQIVVAAACHPQVVAIGEAGLDKARHIPLDLQQMWFERHIALSEQVAKPLVIHCVRAYSELLAIHKRCRPQQPWIVHAFRGNYHIAQQLTARQIYLSFGAHFNTTALSITPSHLILAETDEGGDIVHNIAQMAAARRQTYEQMVQTLDENGANLFFRTR